jgi:hypothetical protein
MDWKQVGATATFDGRKRLTTELRAAAKLCFDFYRRRHES